MSKLLSKNSSNSRHRKQQQKVKKIILRLCVWCLFILIPIGIIGVAKIGIFRLFLSANNHFVLKQIDIDIVKGNFSKDYLLSTIGLTPGIDNIYSIGLKDLRTKLLNDPIIQEIEVRRKLPNTLSLIVYGRTPIAQLLNNDGRLIDSDGIILGDRLKKDTELWPIITGILNVKSFQTGVKLDNPLVLKAIQFLTLKEVMQNGHWLDVHIIQLNENDNEFRIYLNSKDGTYIKQGAILVLPLKNMEEALSKSLQILNVRIKAGQPTSFIDATYDRKIPVRP